MPLLRDRHERAPVGLDAERKVVAKFAALGAITEELYDWTFDINVKGLLFTVQKALPLLPDGASIILNSSVVGSKGLPINSVYSATKASARAGSCFQSRHQYRCFPSGRTQQFPLDSFHLRMACHFKVHRFPLIPVKSILHAECVSSAVSPGIAVC